MRRPQNPSLPQWFSAEARSFPWKEALLRMGADAVLVNAAMVLAFVCWFVFYVVILESARPRELANNFRSYVNDYWLLWTFLALLVFHLHGFYTRARAYASHYKAWVIFRAVSLFIITFVFADYFLFRSALIPRGVAVLGWVFALLGVGGTRLGKDYLFWQYRVEPKHRPKKVERVLVVGGAGYLGSHVVWQLLARGYQTRVLDLLLFGTKPLAAACNHSRFELVRGDVRDIRAVVEAMRGCDAVIDLAAIVGDSACEENRSLAIEINRAATRVLADIARGYGTRRFLFASTCSVYGACGLLKDERSQVSPLSTYAQTKLASEQILLEAGSGNFHPTVLRLGTLFGVSPRMRFDLVVNLLVMQAVKQRRISIFNGHQWRPFLHVRDAARGVVACLEAKPELVSGEIFNLGDDRLNHRLADISLILQELMPGTRVEHVENADARDYRVSFHKIRSQLGFACEATLADGMLEICEAIQSGELQDFAAPQFSNVATIRAFTSVSGVEPSPLRKLAVLAGSDS